MLVVLVLFEGSMTFGKQFEVEFEKNLALKKAETGLIVIGSTY